MLTRPNASSPPDSEEQVIAPHPEDDDEQLTIRIPNPKAYMARQSQWIGRRGKPRCDHCRSANLKCDRVLPACNHCSWANEKECKYTPLPTPAHRGIPRCDRCRTSNQKCDRNLPVCGYCKEAEDGKGVPCNYTPKKRNNKRLLDGDGDNSGDAEVQRWDSPKAKARRRKGNDMAINPAPAPRTDHTFYGQNVASTSALPRHHSATHFNLEPTPDVDPGHTGRFTANFASGRPNARVEMTQAPVPDATIEAEYAQAPRIIHSPVLPHSQTHPFLPPNHGIRVSTQPWSHPSFIPLPEFARKDLAQIDYSEHPTRLELDTAVWTMTLNLAEGLQETALLNIDVYVKTAHALWAENRTGMSERIYTWTNMHRLSSGSGKYNVILVPRDSVFSMDEQGAETHRRHFMDTLMDPAVDAARLQACQYGRLPVQNQLYDILSWAHRNHASAGQMLEEVDSLGFAFVTWTMTEIYAQLCPHCNRWRESEVASVVVPVVDTIYSPTPMRTPLAVPTWGPYVPAGY